MAIQIIILILILILILMGKVNVLVVFAVVDFLHDPLAFCGMVAVAV